MPYARSKNSESGDYLAGIMDRIREFCSIPPMPEIENGVWSYVLGNGIERKFKLEPYPTCGYRLMFEVGKKWCQISCVKNENEAQIIIDDFLCGIDASI